jgi:hypothetical protein
MLRYKKALLVIMLLMISLACSVSLSKDKGNQDSAPIDAQSQPQAAGTPKLDYNVPIRTEVISPVSFLSLAKNYSFTETTTGLSRTLVVLENNSTDPQDIITDFEGKMTWFDESNQVIDEIEVIGFGTNIFPQEKQRFQSYPDPNKVNDRKIGLVRFELTKIATVKSGNYQELKDKISKQNWSHPFVTAAPGAFRIEPYLIDYSMGISKVTVQNTINSKIKVTVVGLYYNDKNELVGMGASGSFELAPLGSSEVDVATGNLSSVPVRIDYYVEINSSLGVIEMMDILYP